MEHDPEIDTCLTHFVAIMCKLFQEERIKGARGI